MCEPVCKLVQKLRDIGPKHLKHRTYVDNCAAAFPLLKETYERKFTELDFSQNLSLRPKDEVQSAHFSGKQFTLHCSIVEPTENRYHYHLSDDTKHNPFFLDVVLRDIISKYKIQNEDLWIQSDNAPSQYKNKHAFSLYQKLAEDLNLRITRTYGAAGHGKGVIDAMSSFGAKNILRHVIVTQNIFFNDSESITNYLQSVTKIVRLIPPPPLFNVGCKFACSFVVLAAWQCFFRLGTTLSQGGGGILGNFKQV